MIRWLNKIFGSRLASAFCFLFAVANRIIFASLYSLIGVDTKLQLTYAENLLAGKGMGAIKYFTHDLSTPVFDTQQYFPPGFSFTIIPFLKLFGGDEYKAVFAFDITVAILFIIAVKWLGKTAGLPAALNNVVVLITGCSQYFFFMSWSSTDAVGVCLVLFSLLATIITIQKKENISFLKALSIGLLFCSPFFFRYMYLPIALLLPVIILTAGFILKNKLLRSAALKICTAVVFFLTLYFLLSLSSSGNALYITNLGRGVFINQLTECYPFLPASGINIDFVAQLVQTILGIDYSRTMLVLRIANPIILVLLIYFLVKYLFTYKTTNQFSSHSVFILAGSLVSLVIILLLTWLSITYKELSWGYYKWTHMQDPRYFAFIYVFVPLLLLVCLHHYRQSFKKWGLRFLALVALGCFALETIHGVYYNMKILVAHKDLEYIREADKGFRSFPAIIKEIEKQNPERQVIVCSPDKFYLHTASQMGYKAIFDYDTFLQTDLKVLSKTILIMPIQSHDVSIIKDYIEKKRPRLVFTIAGTSFYTQEIDP